MAFHWDLILSLSPKYIVHIVLGAFVPLLAGYFFSSQCAIDGFSPRGGSSLDASCCDAWPW